MIGADMLTFIRNKLVNVEISSEGTYIADGFLEDDMYGVEVTFCVNDDDMTISWIQGRWKRYTTPDCPRALPVLQEIVGFSLTDEDFNQNVQKIVSRKGCRHFANIILECCDAVCKTRQMKRGPEEKPGNREKLPKDSSMTPPTIKKTSVQAIKNAVIPFEELEDAPAGFTIDLHVHTSPASPCASSSVDEIIEDAKRIGLDGICLTDHNFQWARPDVAALRKKHGFTVLRGCEVTTVQGDILVFGLDEDIPGIITLTELAEKVTAVGGFMIAAHPFRGFLVVGGDKLVPDVEKAAARPVFSLVDGVEVLNSKVTTDENRFCGKVTEILGLPATGGSDAHGLGEVGVYATRFSKIIRSEEELISALRAGGGVPVAFRNQK